MEFSGVALCFIPQNGKLFFSKERVPFSTTGYALRAVQESCSVKEIYRLKEDCFVYFMKKKTRGPGKPSFSRKKLNESGQNNWRWRSLTIFTKEASSAWGQNVWCAPAVVACLCCTLSHVVKQKMTIALSSACVWGDSVQLIEWDGCSRLSWQRADAAQRSCHCEKCDWMTGKSAGQNFHENRAKFDQKSSFNRSARRASAIPLPSGRERP